MSKGNNVGKAAGERTGAAADDSSRSFQRKVHDLIARGHFTSHEGALLSSVPAAHLPPYFRK